MLAARALGNTGVLVRSAAVSFNVAALWSYAASSFTAARTSEIDTSVKFTWKPKYVNPAYWVILLDGEPLSPISGSTRSITLTGFEPGKHTFTIKPMDESGALGGVSTSRSVTLDPKWLTSGKTATVKAAMNTKADRSVTLTITAQKKCAAPYWDIYDLTVSETEPIARAKGGTSLKITAKLYEQCPGTHLYAVRAANSADQQGPMSAAAELNVVPLTCLSVTSLKAALAQKNTGWVKLTWKAPYGTADRYVLSVRMIVDEVYQEIWSTELPACTSYSLPMPLDNGVYRFYITPYSDEPEGTVEGYTTSVKLKLNVGWKKAPTIKAAQQKTASGTVKLTLKTGGTNRSASLQLCIDGGDWISLSKGVKYTCDDYRLECTKDNIVMAYGLDENVTHTLQARYLASGGECSLVTTQSLTLVKAGLFPVTSLKAVQTEELTLTASWKPFDANPDLTYEVLVKKGRTTVLTEVTSETSLVVPVSVKGTYTVTVTPLLDGNRGDAKSASCSVVNSFWKCAPVINGWSQTDYDEVTIHFNAVSAATGYVVYNGNSILNSGVTFTQNGADSQVIVTGLSGSHKLYICAYQLSGSKIVYGSKSARISFTIGTPDALADPMKLTVTAGEEVGSLALSWSAANAQGFRFYALDCVSNETTEIEPARLEQGDSWTALITGLQDSTWQIGLQPVMTKADGTVVTGRTVWFTRTAVIVPGTARRQNVTATAPETGSSISLTWENPAESVTPDSLLIYLDGNLSAQISGSACSAALPLVAKGLHQVSIVAISGNEVGLPSLAVEVPVFNPTELAQPTGLTQTTANDGTLCLTWSARTPDAFRVYAVADGDDVLLGEVTECSISLESLALGQYNVYVVPVSRVEDYAAVGTPSAEALVSVNRCVDESGLCYATSDFVNATVTGLTGDASVVVIPSTMGCCSVTAIAASAFEGSGTLQSITIPASVTSIGRRAFACCEMLSVMK